MFCKILQLLFVAKLPADLLHRYPESGKRTYRLVHPASFFRLWIEDEARTEDDGWTFFEVETSEGVSQGPSHLSTNMYVCMYWMLHTHTYIRALLVLCFLVQCFFTWKYLLLIPYNLFVWSSAYIQRDQHHLKPVNKAAFFFFFIKITVIFFFSCKCDTNARL